jgi:hypothetical protein
MQDIEGTLLAASRSPRVSIELEESYRGDYGEPPTRERIR